MRAGGRSFDASGSSRIEILHSELLVLLHLNSRTCGFALMGCVLPCEVCPSKHRAMSNTFSHCAFLCCTLPLLLLCHVPLVKVSLAPQAGQGYLVLHKTPKKHNQPRFVVEARYPWSQEPRLLVSRF
ncbi:unnamed protein product, partial [Discosporangium mesarthrocarpum]